MYSLNKLESYSRFSALGPVGHCTSHFKRAVCISCRPCVDVHKGGGGCPAHVDACGQGEGVKNVIFCGRHKWMATYAIIFQPSCRPLDLILPVYTTGGAIEECDAIHLYYKQRATQARDKCISFVENC